MPTESDDHAVESAASTATNTGAAATTEPATATPEVPATDVKAQFLQALQRKQGLAGEAHGSGPGAATKIHGASGRAGNKREFRRKSGG
jgi:Family of unknown function (DUF5302)